MTYLVGLPPTARKQCVLVVEHRAIASVSIYRRVKPRVLSKIAATHSLLAELHYVDLSCSRDSPVVRLTGASRWSARLVPSRVDSDQCSQLRNSTQHCLLKPPLDSSLS